VNGGWAFSDSDSSLVQGKVVNTIRFKASAAGFFPILTGNSRATMKPVACVVVNDDEVDTVVTKSFEDVLVGATSLFGIGQADACGFYFAKNIPGKVFWSKIPSNQESNAQNCSLCIDVGYF
jgi:hypothetical protein